MAVSVEMHNTGNPSLRIEVAAVIEDVLSQRSGDWRVVILGSQANDQLKIKITGPNAFERSYTLEGTHHHAGVSTPGDGSDQGCHRLSQSTETQRHCGPRRGSRATD